MDNKRLLTTITARDASTLFPGASERRTKVIRRTDCQRDIRRQPRICLSEWSADPREVSAADNTVRAIRSIRPVAVPVRGSGSLAKRGRPRHSVSYGRSQQSAASERRGVEARAYGIERDAQQSDEYQSQRLFVTLQQLRPAHNGRNKVPVSFTAKYRSLGSKSQQAGLQPEAELRRVSDQRLQRPEGHNYGPNRQLSGGSQADECLGGAGVPRNRRSFRQRILGVAAKLRFSNARGFGKQPESGDHGRSAGLLPGTTPDSKRRKPAIALLIAGHNEALVIEHTLRSAIKAGLRPEHIYVVDDNSDDGTADIARRVLRKGNVISVERSGKGLAISKAATAFSLTARYKWIHLADADGEFGSDYFRILRQELNAEFAAATGYVRSMRGSVVSQYRVFEYTFGMEVVRRFQDMIGTIPIIPGPTSCFRADIFAQLEFGNGALAEDFDVTLQIHRQNLGNIQFIEDAVVYTQDPETIKDFTRQIHRWNKGVMQGIIRHGIGTKFSKLDAYLMYQLGMSLSMVASYCVLLPVVALERGLALTIPTVFLFDIGLLWLVVSYIALCARRWDILTAFPHIYLLRWISMVVFVRSFVEVMVLRRHGANGVWQSVARKKTA